MSAAPSTPKIPQPPTVPVLGNLMSMDPARPVASFAKLAGEYGPIYRLTLPNREFIVLNDHALVDEACDTTRFTKTLPAPLVRLRDLAADGLFTAYNDEPNWAIAHRILMPAFSLDAMRGYHDAMLDVGVQMVDRWARLRPDESIDVPDAMTRLTLDVIALTGFDYRLNSFYHDEMHPFVDNMVNALKESMRADKRPPIVDQMMWRTRQRFERDIADMHGLVDELIRQRRAQPPRDEPARDLLGLMLEATDPVTGQSLDDENIRNQVVTFLIASNETTSFLFSFSLFNVTAHTEIYARAVAEVDAVVGGPERLPSYTQLGQLHYLDQVLYETLRLWAPAPGFVVSPIERTTLGGRWVIDAGEKLVLLMHTLHRDPAIWSDPERFDPERFTPEAITARPPNAWKPFGNGMRACIGRQFAMQEAKLSLALMLQRFAFSFDDPDYELDVAETLTLKPVDLRLRVALREGRSITTILSRSAPTSEPARARDDEAVAHVAPHGATLIVGYGSNMGTTRQLAERVGAHGRRTGYAVEVLPLDDLVGRDLRAPDALVLLTASYNGHPPDNALRFCSWLDTLSPGDLDGVDYTVFGCGHTDWAATFQAVPRRVDEALARAGATRLQARGEGNGADDLVGALDAWEDATWPAVHAHAGVLDVVGEVGRVQAASIEAELLEVPSSHSEAARPMRVLENRELVDMSAPFARSKRHVALALPEGTTYSVGDHLLVTSVNDPARVERFAGRLGWDLERVVVLRARGGAPSTLPIDRPIALRALLGRHLELGKPIFRRQLEALLEHTPCPPERARLTAWLSDEDAFDAEVRLTRLSLLDVLELLPSCAPPVDLVLANLEPLTPRIYSIASAPQAHPDEVHLTVSVLDAPADSGHGRHRGVASTWLAERAPGDTVWASVRTPDPVFAPPEDLGRPLVLIGAGTGYAPFRGFLQQRAAERAEGAAVGPIAVFSGCDRDDVDLLYADELHAHRDAGLIDLFVACSEAPDGDVQFVQHRLWAERANVWSMLEAGAAVYVCGDGRRMAPAVRETLQRIHAEATGASPEETQAWWASCLDGSGEVRFHEDAWAG